MSSFAELGLAEPILRAVAEKGYVDPTPIQAQAIPVVLSGLDMMGGAQTGTGKTAGFVLPILNKLLRHANTSTSPARHQIRALILAPTRELAVQVEESVQSYAKYTNLRSTVLYGGVPIDPQMAILRQGVEIVVATPGRLLDHVQQRTVNLGQVEVFVLDEADRMLDMGFIPDIKRIIALLPKERQSLLFSATFPDDVKRLADTLLKNPVTIQVAKRNALAEGVVHRVHPVARERKRDLLIHLIRSRNMHQVLVFTGTRMGCNRLTYQLNKEGVHAAAIHGDKTQTERTEALEAFKAGKVGVLVATDVAARGLDIEELPSVVNFDLPHTPDDYVHRIGRTGRAGKEGEAISLVSPDDHEKLADIEKMLKRRIECLIVEGFSPDGRDAATIISPPVREPSGRRDEGHDRLTHRPEPRRTESSRQESSRGGARSGRRNGPMDPIFTKPYEPGIGIAPPKQPSVDQVAAKRPQVAALLGGLVKR